MGLWHSQKKTLPIDVLFRAPRKDFLSLGSMCKNLPHIHCIFTKICRIFTAYFYISSTCGFALFWKKIPHLNSTLAGGGFLTCRGPWTTWLLVNWIPKVSSRRFWKNSFWQFKICTSHTDFIHISLSVLYRLNSYGNSSSLLMLQNYFCRLCIN